MAHDGLFSRIFSLHAVAAALEDDLAVGLRMLADSIEKGEIVGEFTTQMRCPLREWHTDMIRTRIVIDLAGPADSDPTLPPKAS